MSLHQTEVLAAVRECPGITTQALAERLGHNANELNARLNRLSRQGYVRRTSKYPSTWVADGECRPHAKTPRRMDKWMLEHDGKVLHVEEWAKAVGISSTTIRSRIRRGWTVGQALTRPSMKERDAEVGCVICGRSVIGGVRLVSHRTDPTSAGGRKMGHIKVCRFCAERIAKALREMEDKERGQEVGE